MKFSRALFVEDKLPDDVVLAAVVVVATASAAALDVFIFGCWVVACDTEELEMETID
jgi:hypothetical protein